LLGCHTVALVDHLTTARGSWRAGGCQVLNEKPASRAGVTGGLVATPADCSVGLLDRLLQDGPLHPERDDFWTDTEPAGLLPAGTPTLGLGLLARRRARLKLGQQALAPVEVPGPVALRQLAQVVQEACAGSGGFELLLVGELADGNDPQAASASAVSRISKGSRTKQMRDRGIELS
jgi:hypothetical protein